MSAASSGAIRPPEVRIQRHVWELQGHEGSPTGGDIAVFGCRLCPAEYRIPLPDVGCIPEVGA